MLQNSFNKWQKTGKTPSAELSMSFRVWQTCPYTSFLDYIRIFCYDTIPNSNIYSLNVPLMFVFILWHPLRHSHPIGLLLESKSKSNLITIIINSLHRWVILKKWFFQFSWGFGNASKVWTFYDLSKPRCKCSFESRVSKNDNVFEYSDHLGFSSTKSTLVFVFVAMHKQ